MATLSKKVASIVLVRRSKFEDSPAHMTTIKIGREFGLDVRLTAITSHQALSSNGTEAVLALISSPCEAVSSSYEDEHVKMTYCKRKPASLLVVRQAIVESEVVLPSHLRHSSVGAYVQNKV